MSEISCVHKENVSSVDTSRPWLVDWSNKQVCGHNIRSYRLFVSTIYGPGLCSHPCSAHCVHKEDPAREACGHNCRIVDTTVRTIVVTITGSRIVSTNFGPMEGSK